MAITTLIPVEYSAQRVLTTEQLAQVYECTMTQIKQNFNNNKEHFVEGKHYFKLESDALKHFKNRVENFDLVGKNANTLYLWTKRGALRHCKMLGTEKAWEMFDLLEENYFDGKKSAPAIQEVKPSQMVVEIGAMSTALQDAFGVKQGIALAKATDTVSEYYKFDLTPLKELIPPAEHEVGLMNATEVGKLVGLSAREANKKLTERGLQVKEGKEYRLTEKGKEYGEMQPYTRGGHSGYQIKWSPQICTVLLENSIH